MTIPKNPNVDRVANIPFDKDSVLPFPQVTRKPRPGAGPSPIEGGGHSQGKEEYPGPRTSSTGERSEPGTGS
jgi:hypothetical protein